MLNRWEGIGRLAADPETKFTTSSKQVTTFTLCCDSGYGDNKRTEYARIVTWTKLAEICDKYLKKGSLAYVSGEMNTRQWEDQDGNKRYTTEIVAREMKMLGGKQESNHAPQEPYGGIGGDTGSDVPF